MAETARLAVRVRVTLLRRLRQYAAASGAVMGSARRLHGLGAPHRGRRRQSMGLR